MVPVQYWHYLSALVHGNLGYSFKLKQPVVDLFEQRWARSLYLSGVSLLLAILVTIPLGIYQAIRRDRLGDHLATGLELTVYAMLDLLFYLIAIQLFAFTVPLFNYEARQSASLLTVARRSQWLSVLAQVHSDLLAAGTFWRSCERFLDAAGGGGSDSLVDGERFA